MESPTTESNQHQLGQDSEDEVWGKEHMHQCVLPRLLHHIQGGGLMILFAYGKEPAVTLVGLQDKEVNFQSLQQIETGMCYAHKHLPFHCCFAA